MAALRRLRTVRACKDNAAHEQAPCEFTFAR